MTYVHDMSIVLLFCSNSMLWNLSRPENTIHADSICCRLQQQHALETEETCTQYNMLKIARYLFRWTVNVTYADYYERAIMNGLLGTQRMPATDQPHLPAEQSEQHPATTRDHSTGSDTALQHGLLQLPSRATAKILSRYCSNSTVLYMTDMTISGMQ